MHCPRGTLYACMLFSQLFGVPHISSSCGVTEWEQSQKYSSCWHLLIVSFMKVLAVFTPRPGKWIPGFNLFNYEKKVHVNSQNGKKEAHTLNQGTG